MDQQTRPSLPPFDEASAREKVKAAQDAWNTRDPEKVALTFTEDSKWRNREEFFEGSEEIKAFLTRKWERELDYRLQKYLWCITQNRIAVRFEYEPRDRDGRWWGSHTYDRIATPTRPSSPGGSGPGLVEGVAQ